MLYPTASGATIWSETWVSGTGSTSQGSDSRLFVGWSGHLVWGAGFRQCGRSVGLRVWGFEFGVRAWRHSSMGQQMCLPCRLERAVGILKVPRPHGPRLCHVAMSLGCCATPNLKHCPGVRPRLLVAEVLLDMLDVLLSLPISIMSSSSYSSTRFSAVL